MVRKNYFKRQLPAMMAASLLQPLQPLQAFVPAVLSPLPQCLQGGVARGAGYSQDAAQSIKRKSGKEWRGDRGKEWDNPRDRRGDARQQYTYSRAGRGRRSGASPSTDPHVRLRNLNKKLSSIYELEESLETEINEEQRKKIARKQPILEEISRLTKLIKQRNFIEGAAEKRAAAESADDLSHATVGGNIPRTLLKLLTYCRVSDRETCEILLELNKVKVNGKVNSNPLAMVDLVKDSIEFDGQPVSLPDGRLKQYLRPAEDEAENQRYTAPKDYRARIDGGLLIDKTRQAMKARGDWIDKSPYIMRDRRK